MAHQHRYRARPTTQRHGFPLSPLLAKKHQRRHLRNVQRINAMPLAEFERLIQAGQCPYEPEHLVGVPLGMFHCECCGEMVVAGFKHPRGDGPTRTFVR